MRAPSALLAMLAAVFLTAGCGGHRSENTERGLASNGTFTMAIKDDPGVFDPYRHNLGGYAGFAYDSLLKLQPDGSFVSSLAEKWKADANAATFTLRQGITCSDGTPLTASQVAADLTYMGDPKNQSPQYGMNIPTVPFTATGQDTTRTVNVVMKQPFGFLLNMISQAPIMCAKGLKDPSLLKTASDGTGPFVLSSVVPGQSYTFTVRKGYAWGPGGAATNVPGTPAKVVLRIISNEATAANLLLSGELNFATISGDDRQRLDAQGLKRLKEQQSGAWLWLNHLGGRPTADIRVRQALVHALDLGQIVKVNSGGTGSAATGLIPLEPRPCTSDTVAGRLPGHDVGAAESLLDQAGWTRGADSTRSKHGKPMTLDLHYWPAGSPFNKPAAELVAQQWQAIGVKVKLSADSATTFSQVMYQTGDYDVYMQGFGYNLPSQMVSYLSGQAPPKGTNLSGIRNKDYDTLTAKANTLVPPAACTYWDQAEQALWRDVDIVPVAKRPAYHYLKNALAQARGYNLPLPTSIRMLK